MKITKNALVILAASFALAGCNEQHEHTFDSVWSYNDECHWKKATCEHTELSMSLGSHTYNDAGYCTVCGKEIASHFKAFTFTGDHCSVEAEPYYHLGDTITFHIIPNEGYGYPKYVDVSKGLSDVQYNTETGLVSGVVTDDIEAFAISRRLNANTYISEIEVDIDGYDGFYYKEKHDYDEIEKAYTYQFSFRYETDSGYEESLEKKKYTYNELNQLVKYEENFEDGVFNKYYLYSYNSNGTIKDETIYKVMDGATQLVGLKTYSYDEYDRLKECIDYEDDCETPESKKMYTYSEGTVTMYKMDYRETYYSTIYYDKDITEFDQSKGTKTITHITNSDPGEGVTAEELEGIDVYDLTTNKLISSYASGQDENYTYNEKGDLLEKEVWNRETASDPSYQENGMYISYNDRFQPISGTYGQAQDCEYVDSVLDFTFDLDDAGLTNSVTFNKQSKKNAASIKYKYVEIDNNIAVPDKMSKAYEPGSYPIYPESEIFQMIRIELLIN